MTIPEPSRSGAPDAVCSHCSLPVPRGLVEDGANHQFCCNGCRTVFSVLHDHGLDRYYDVVTATGEQVPTARPTDRTYAELDDPAFRGLYCQQGPGGTLSVELYLENVHCAACVWLVEKVPLAIDGVAEARLELTRSLARVTFDPTAARLSDIARFLDSLGYPVRPYRGVKVREMRRREDRALLIRIAVAGAAAGNVMLMSFALYGGMFSGMEAEYRALFHWASLLVSLPAVLWAGSLFFRGAWAALRTRTLHMDLPVALGLTAGLLSGTAHTIVGEGAVYFDSVTVLVFLLLIGRAIQLRQQRAAANAAELLYSLAPSVARVVTGDGETREVPVEALLAGAFVEARAGDSIPADGIVVDGASDLDTSLLTGESRPVAVAPGDAVHAGTVNLTARLLLRVEQAGEHTRVARLMKMVEESARRRAPIVLMADRISGVFVAVVLALSVLTAAIWLWLDPSEAVDNAVAVLIITCPCALGLATPLAVSVAVGRAARAGILIKGGDAVERLARPGRVLLDKTGTLTEGRTSLVRSIGDASALPLACAIEAESSHPIARAFREAVEPSSAPVTSVASALGGGMTGRVGGRGVIVGSPAFVEARCPVSRPLRDAVDDLVGGALTPVLIAVDDVVVTAVGFGDPLRAEARATLEQLRELGYEVGILSGARARSG